MADPPGIGDSAIDKSNIAAAGAESQVFHSWANLTRQLGLHLPRWINKSIQARAGIDRLAAKWNAK